MEGRFDPLALELAKEVQIAGYFSLEHPNLQPTVLLHVLIYEIADGTMVLSFPQFPEAGGDQLEYWGCARLSVMKKDGKWTEIKGPEGLHGKGWAVRHGFGNRAEAILKMEMKRLPWDG